MNFTQQEQMPLLVLNQSVSIYVRQVTTSMSYQIALRMMIKKKIDRMLHYYENKGSKLINLNDLQ